MRPMYIEVVLIGGQTFPIFDTADEGTHGQAYQFQRIQKTGMIVAYGFFGDGLGFVEAEWSELWNHPGAVVRASDSGKEKERFDEVRINLAVARERVGAVTGQ